MKYLIPLLAVVLHFMAASAEELNVQKSTVLNIISPQGYIGQGVSLLLAEEQGYKINAYKPYDRENCFSIAFENSERYWNVDFSAASDLPLQPGIYRNATRFPFNENNPGLSVTTNGRASNELNGEFEVLEVVKDKEGNITSFAANFTQDGDLFGSLRYNSNLPLALRFTEMFANIKENSVYLRKISSFDETLSPEVLCLTGEQANIEIKTLPYCGDGVEICIDAKEAGIWKFEFAAPVEDILTKGLYANVVRYPYNGFLTPGIDIVSSGGNYDNVTGWFKVLKCKRNDDNSIQEIALSFEVKNYQGELLEGAIHYKGEPVKAEQEFGYVRNDANSWDFEDMNFSDSFLESLAI